MHNSHLFLIQDEDSVTNFNLSSLPVQFACGYNFCDISEASTRSQNSQGSQKGELVLKPKRSTIHPKDDLDNNQKNKENEIYHESAIRKHLTNLEQAYAQHKIDVANYEAHKLQKLCQKSHHKLTKDELHLIMKVQRQMKDVHEYEKILNQKGWELQKEKKNLKVSTKMQQNTVGVLVEAYLDVEIQNFLSVMIQIDLMKQWMPFMETSKLQKIVSRNCRIGHCVNNFPIIAKRQSFFQGIGYDRMSHNKTVFMYTRSLNENNQLQRQIGYTVHQTEGTVQLDYKYFILEYSPDTPQSGTLKMAINVDMKLNIPMFILGPATEGFGIDFYQNVRKIAKNFKGSKWEKKIQQNSSFFDFVKKRIRQHFYEKEQSQKKVIF